MDALATLKADHRRIGHLITKLELTTERAEKFRAELFEQLLQEFIEHMHLEEEVLHSFIKEYRQTSSMRLEAMEEHEALKLLFTELASIPVDSEEWAAKFEVLKESLLLNIAGEEQELFPKVRKVLSPEEWEDLSVLFEEAKLHPNTSSRSGLVYSR
jgi:hypothetical protein